MSEDKITWTEEQTKVIRKMISESEDIGWVQGYDEAIKEIIIDLEKVIFELKKKIYIRDKKEIKQ